MLNKNILIVLYELTYFDVIAIDTNCIVKLLSINLTYSLLQRDEQIHDRFCLVYWL